MPFPPPGVTPNPTCTDTDNAQTASSVTASKPKAGKTTSGRVSKPAPTTRITRSAAVKAPPKEPEGATEQDMSRDFVEIGLTAQYLLKTWESGLGRPKHEGKTRGYKHLRLSRRAGSGSSSPSLTLSSNPTTPANPSRLQNGPCSTP